MGVDRGGEVVLRTLEALVVVLIEQDGLRPRPLRRLA